MGIGHLPTHPPPSSPTDLRMHSCTYIQRSELEHAPVFPSPHCKKWSSCLRKPSYKLQPKHHTKLALPRVLSPQTFSPNTTQGGFKRGKVEPSVVSLEIQKELPRTFSPIPGQGSSSLGRWSHLLFRLKSKRNAWKSKRNTIFWFIIILYSIFCNQSIL